MGYWDDKNIEVNVELHENLTDPRCMEFTKNWDFTCQEYIDFEKKIGLYHTEMAERILSFFVDYKDGALLPDRWDSSEPLKKDFKKEDLSDVIDVICSPGETVYLKKRRKVDITIYNRTFGIVYDGGGKGKNARTTPPIASLPEYLTCIGLSYAKQRKIDMEFLKQFLRDFCAYLRTDTDRAYIYDMEHERRIIYDLFHPENVGKRYWDDCYSY